MQQGIRAVEHTGNKIVAVQAGMNGLVEMLAGLAIGLVVLYAGWRNFSFGDTPGQFFAFIAALLMAADPLRRLSRLQLQLAAAAMGTQMTYDLLDMPATERAAPAPAAFLGTRTGHYLNRWTIDCEPIPCLPARSDCAGQPGRVSVRGNDP